MDYLGEIIALGIDTVIFGICLKQYFHCKNAITAVKVKEMFVIEYFYLIVDISLRYLLCV